METIKRDLYLKKLISRKENGMIKIVTGIRRCGKSYLLFKLYYDYLLSIGVKKNQIITLDLDDDNNREYRNIDSLSKYIYSKIIDENEMYYILLDEVQFTITEEEIKSNGYIRLYGLLNGLIRKHNVDVYITGSNSRFLSSDIRTEFRGRGDEIRVYPLSFSEFYSAFNGDKYKAWNEYIIYGGLPYILSIDSDEQKVSYLNSLFNNLYIKDVIEKNKIKHDDYIDTIVNLLASSIGSLTNPKRLAMTFKSKGMNISEHTISSYISFLEDSFLINKVERYDIKGKKYIDSPYKFYYCDVGLRNARLNFRQIEENHIMENIIYNELLIRGFNVDVGIVSIRSKDKDGKQIQKMTEVDFVCNLGYRRYYIQCALSIPNREKMEQEQYSLIHIDDHFKKIIVVKDYIPTWINEKGVLIISALDFLLNPNSLDL